MAVTGIDIRAMLYGAEEAITALDQPDLLVSPAYQYAAVRKLLYERGKKIEVFASYEPHMASFSE